MIDDYAGPVTLTAPDGTTIRTTAVLRTMYDPVAGRTRWYGRLAPDAATTALAHRHARNLTLAVPGGPSATTTLTDADPWSRYRVSGTLRPAAT